jgi:hypothetical protein
MMDKDKASEPEKFSIRAIPPTGFSHRYRAGRKWEKEATIVKVVANPAPHRVDKDRDGNSIVIYSDEISPKDLESLKSDRYFAVVPAGMADPGSLALNAEKVARMKAEEEAAALRKELADAREWMAKAEGDLARLREFERVGESHEKKRK